MLLQSWRRGRRERRGGLRYLDDCDYFDDQKVERGDVVSMIIRLLVMIIMAIPTTVVMITIVMIIITNSQ